MATWFSLSLLTGVLETGSLLHESERAPRLRHLPGVSDPSLQATGD